MNKLNFAALFQKHIEEALRDAEQKLGEQLSRNVEIEMHGAGYSGQLMNFRTAVDSLYISQESFYRIIDIGVKAVSKQRTRVFVRPSGHAPTEYDKTWNTPQGSGPFKILGVEKVSRLDD